jgi:hypothetical protein
MRRRNILKSALGLPAAAAALPPPAQAQSPAPSSATPKLEALSADAAINGVARFFTNAQYGALRRLSGIILPAYQEQPSAVDAGVPELLDFYISQSSAATQQLWTQGLDRLERESRQRYKKGFRELSAQEYEPLLAPLTQPWTYQGPSDPFARFLLAARDLVLQAAFNSREWSEAGGRRASGVNYLWRNLD